MRDRKLRMIRKCGNDDVLPSFRIEVTEIYSQVDTCKLVISVTISSLLSSPHTPRFGIWHWVTTVRPSERDQRQGLLYFYS